MHPICQIFTLVFLLSFSSTLKAQQVFISTGKVDFTSTAPLEVIKASSDELKGVLDLSANTFAFAVIIKSFNGFNSPLQQEHFNENFMESERFPKAIFKGKIVEDIKLLKPGTYQIRAKGSLQIHGVAKDRILPVTVTITETEIKISAQFDVQLADHDISIPKLVHQKIAETIKVNIEATLGPL